MPEVPERLRDGVKWIFDRFDLEIRRKYHPDFPVEATDEERRIIRSVLPYTMTSATRVWALLRAVEYIVENDIPGDFVECGVWRGGSAMAIAWKLRDMGVDDRRLVLYDTFAGMTPPTGNDVEIATGRSAASLLAETERVDGNNLWCIASLDDVRSNIGLTGYPLDRVEFVVGDVAETLPLGSSEEIALLRLDTDWYESTRAELEFLYPVLSGGGVCIIDDYGHWDGSRRAVDEFLSEAGIHPFVHRIDYCGRLFVKDGLGRSVDSPT